MKKLLLVAILFITCISTSNAQDLLKQFPETDGKVLYESVADVPGKNKDFIYFAANKWLLDIPNGIKSHVVTQDKDQGQIIGSGSFIHTRVVTVIAGDAKYRFKIQIDCKDNKYRVRFYEISYTDMDNSSNITLEEANEYLLKSDVQPRHKVAAEVDSIFNGMISSLKDAMDKAAKDSF